MITPSSLDGAISHLVAARASTDELIAATSRSRANPLAIIGIERTGRRAERQLGDAAAGFRELAFPAFADSIEQARESVRLMRGTERLVRTRGTSVYADELERLRRTVGTGAPGGHFTEDALLKIRWGRDVGDVSRHIDVAGTRAAFAARMGRFFEASADTVGSIVATAEDGRLVAGSAASVTTTHRNVQTARAILEQLGATRVGSEVNLGVVQQLDRDLSALVRELPGQSGASNTASNPDDLAHLARWAERASTERAAIVDRLAEVRANRPAGRYDEMLARLRGETPRGREGADTGIRDVDALDRQLQTLYDEVDGTLTPQLERETMLLSESIMRAAVDGHTPVEPAPLLEVFARLRGAQERASKLVGELDVLERSYRTPAESRWWANVGPS